MDGTNEGDDARDAGELRPAATTANDDGVTEHVAATDIVGMANEGDGVVPSDAATPSEPVAVQVDGDSSSGQASNARVRNESNESARSEVKDTVSNLQGANTDLITATRRKTMTLERFSSFDASNVESLMSGGFDRFLGKVKNARRAHNLAFPTPEIHFEDLSYTVWLSRESAASKSSIGGYFRSVVAPWRKLRTVKKPILHPMSGIIRPGSMTLILASPGAGKSTFLKAIAGKLTSRNGRRALKGKISFSGLAAEEITISKLVGLMDQLDNHFATLTVRETIQFADRCLNGPPENQPEKLREVARLRTDLVLHLLGLTKCADTYVGDALLRGVSGGERKRVTVGEMLVGGQSVFLCDEISTGLDSAATFDIVKSMRDWSRTLGGSAVIALLQPPPEVVELFDDILILSEGRLVFHGPRVEMLPYFSKLGFECPAHVDPAEFAVDVASGLGGQFIKPQASLAEDEALKPPRLATQFEERFQQSSIYLATLATMATKKQHHSLANQNELESVAPLIAKNSHASLYKAGFFEMTRLLLERQKKIWLRDRALVFGKLAEAVLVGFLLGIIYLNAKTTIYLRMLFFVIAIFQRQAWSQITIAFQVRNIFYKQRSRNFFRTLAYTISESVVQMPLNVAVSLTLTVIFYFMSGLARSADTFVVHYVILLCFQHAITAYFTLLAAVSPTITIAQALASLSVSFFLLFSGNIILPKLIPHYWIWMYWFNPLAWTLRAVLLNEFHDDRYSDLDREAGLARFQVTQGPEFIWIGILVLIAYYVLFTLFNTAVLRFIHYEFQSTAASSANATEGSYSAEDKIKDGCVDSSRAPSVDTPVDAAAAAADAVHSSSNDDVVVQVPPTGSVSDASAQTFVSAYVAVTNLNYFVPSPSGDGELQLLHDVTAYFVPGKMTALMGSSGAGKTTFMDVLAGRKTGGRCDGAILVNGEPKDPRTFSRIAGYCEQMDIHSGGATIREALTFSAQLRLPPTTTPEARAECIQNALDLLELNSIAKELVRNCSVEQKKRITIGVEVVANPSILFLDEPTSGLDARSASIVMQGVRSIARTGRTVVCTIHQPSKQIFELFDALLLLQKGGHTAFFGDVGTASESLLQYFAGIPGTAAMPSMYNPATYMLEVIGAGIGRGETRDYAVEYAKSDLCRRNVALAAAIGSGQFVATSDSNDSPVVMTPFSSLHLSPIATGFSVQLACCVTKMMRTYWRNPQYNLMRMVAFPVYAVIFGTTFYKLTEGTSAAVNSHVGLMYNTLDFIGVINLMTVLETVSAERAVFYRERMSNYYSPLPYAISLFVAEVPYLVLTSLLFMNVEYWLIGWTMRASSFFRFWVVFYLHIANCTSVGQFMVVLLPNIKVANVAVGALSVVFNLFSGFLMPHNQMCAGYKWIRYLVLTNYSLESLVAIEMGQCSDATDHGCLSVQIPKIGAAPAHDVRLATFIADNYDFHLSDVSRNIGVLVAYLAGFQVAIFLTLRFVSHLKR